MTSSFRMAVFRAEAADALLEELLSRWAPAGPTRVVPDVVEAPEGLTAAAVRLTAEEPDAAALRAALREATDTTSAGFLVPETLLGSERALVVTDVDSTLIEQEVIELLAAHAGREAEVAAVTQAAMRGELDFAQSLHHRVQALAGLPVSVIEEVVEQIVPTPGATELIAAAHRAGHRIGAVSGGFSQVLDPLAQRLGLDHAEANVLAARDGVLTGEVASEVVDRAAKRRALLRWSEADAVALGATVALGDGANDLDLLSTAALGVGLQPKPALRERADAVVGMRRLDTVAAALGWPLA